MFRTLRVVTVILLLTTFCFTNAIMANEKKININTATVEELCSLRRVGPNYAQAIVEYRKAHGDFKTPEEIKNVKGIGDKTYEENKSMIVVTDKEN